MEQQIVIATSQGKVNAYYKATESESLVVMLHGLASSSGALFFSKVATLTEHATLRFDFAGHGGSEGEFQMLLFKELEQIAEILAEFPQYRRKIYVGHSKGSALAFLASQSGDTIVSIAGRWNMSQEPTLRYTEDEIERINKGETVLHCFSGKMVPVNIEEFHERESISFSEIMRNKDVKVYVIAGRKDEVMPADDEEQMAAYFGTTVRWLDCGHSGFTYEMVAGILREAFGEMSDSFPE